MKKRLQFLVQRIQALRAEHDKVAQAALQDTLQRQPLILGLAIFSMLLGAKVNWQSIGALAPTALQGIRHASSLNLIMAVWLISAGLFLNWGRSKYCNTTALLALATSFLIFGVLRSAIDQWGSGSVNMFSLCCVFTGTLILIRPAHAIALYAGSYLLFYIAMALTQKNPVILAINQAQGFAAAALGLLLAFLLWRKHTVTTLLQQQLQASNEELQRQKQQLEILSQLDALTGLYNRREFDRLANIELVRAKREGSDTAIIMADLDFFKRINDCFGHPTGDEVIQKTAETLSQNIRASDIVARIGGEEFIILLPKTSLDEALVVAEKLRLSLQENAIQTQISQNIQMTASFGVTAMATHQQGSLNALYAAADLALYAAKNKGRNRVESQNIS